jgi:hypothetical protein
VATLCSEREKLKGSDLQGKRLAVSGITFILNVYVPVKDMIGNPCGRAITLKNIKTDRIVSYKL